jgi:hypothetical protein
MIKLRRADSDEHYDFETEQQVFTVLWENHICPSCKDDLLTGYSVVDQWGEVIESFEPLKEEDLTLQDLLNTNCGVNYYVETSEKKRRKK